MKGAIVLYSIPAFFILIGLELLINYFKHQNRYRLNDSITNLSLGIGSQVVGTLTKVLVFGSYVWTYDHFAFFKLPDSVLVFFVCLVLYDFIYYWSHRWGHTVSLFWGAHIVHHQSEEYNLTVALRQPWFHSLIAFYLFLPLALLGFSPIILGSVAGINLVYQFWIHTEYIDKMPRWFEYIFNTPSHHRVHHAINPKYIDRNHAGMFMIWDRLFGTFQAEDENEKIRYGITKTFGSWNPAWANVHFYTELWDKMKLVDGVGAKLALIFRKPGWNPVSMQEDVILPPSPDMLKYDKDTKSSARIYAVVQFGIVLMGSVMFLVKYPTLTLPYKLLFAGLIIFSIEVIGGLFENKKWAIYGEYLRLAAILLGLNWFYYFQYPNWLIYTLVCSLVLGLLSMIVYRIIQTSPVSNSRSVA
ncbi:MAG: sterol desaturase family protein [Chitinophagales bacterium]